MLIIGGLFVVALVAIVLAVFLAREDKSAPGAQEAVAPEQEATQAIAPVSEVATEPAKEETKAVAQEVSAAQVEKTSEKNTGVIQPAFNELVFPLEDGQPLESQLQVQGQIQELIALVRQLQEQVRTLEGRVNNISDHDEHDSTTFVDIPSIPRNRHP